MNSQQKIDTPVKEHMLKLIGFFAKTEDNGGELNNYLMIQTEI
ncbi:hypothetical protein Goari_003046, partial [Gossypium aridum]|nr:hypothetical protein [Gossypium aridum]